MKIRILVPFIILLVSVFVMGSICGPLSTTSVPTQTSGSTNTVVPTSGIGAVNNLQDVQKATIQIESVGTFVDPQEGVVMNAAGRGSGFIIDPTGIAVTNNHVVTGSALIKVWVNGESNPRNAQIIGVSECSDLAVIKIEGGNFSYLDWYNHSPTVGLEVYTAGFPLGEPQFSMTKGIISKINADGQTNWASLDHTLSHDATQNPGNSGGPLVTADGKVVGITYAGAKAVDQYFAIDAITAQPIVGQLRTGVDIDTIGINGAAFVSEDKSVSGIWIYSVKSGSPADKAGMKGGDILLQMEGLVLATDGTMKDYCDILRTHKPTDTLSVKVYRYSTGEMLEGQINGRSIAVVSSNPPANATSTPSTTQEAPAYFTEEFNGKIPNWWYFLMSGDENKMSLNTDNGKLVFNLTGDNLYVYTMYDPWKYQNVRIDASADNRGMNENSVSLICRYSKDEGWYEFNVGNNGLWQVFVYDKVTGGDYQLLNSGGSTAIKSGKAINEYTAICNGSTLSLYINGVRVTSFEEKHYALREGLVGIGVSSYHVLPIIVGFDWVTISEP
jgi:S1-C subfamily serine protease